MRRPGSSTWRRRTAGVSGRPRTWPASSRTAPRCWLAVATPTAPPWPPRTRPPLLTRSASSSGTGSPADVSRHRHDVRRLPRSRSGYQWRMVAPGGAIELPGLTLLETLGAGGSSVVYLARQEDLDRLVAVKVLRQPVTDPKVWRDFQ